MASYASILWKTIPTMIFLTIIVLLLLIICSFFLLFIVELFRKQENPFAHIAYSVLGIMWIVLPFSLINHIPSMFADGKYLLLTIFIFVWVYDTLAYCIGSIWGRHRLMERISPKKSWEGTIGATLLTIGFASFMPQLFPIFPLTNSQWMFFALIVVVSATLGDLVESLFKRQLSVKDSGTILPGHGGVLDRFDSIFFVIPFIIIYLILIL
jgi:phosphatidate cytidylyltransferase